MELEHWFNLHINNLRQRICLINKNQSYTYVDLMTWTKEYYAIIKGTIEQGDVVAIQSDYSVNSISLFLALIENKNIIVPITTKISKEIEFQIQEAFTDYVVSFDNDKMIIISNKNVEKHQILQTLRKRQNAGVLLFSSGSTGVPKAMVHDLDELLKTYQDKPLKDTKILVFLMFDHIGGLNTLLNALAMGSTIVIPDNRNADYICSLIEKYKIEVLPTSPTFLNLILISEAYKNYNLDSIKLVTYGTEPMPESLLTRITDIFPNGKLLQTFGTSETGIAKTNSQSSDSTLMRLEKGTHEYKVVENELWLRSSTQILGYLNASMDCFTEDGWFKTGDLIEENDDGYIRIIGRAKEVINVGGEKVLPAEVESILLKMPDVNDCMVYGIPSFITGMTVAVDIVLKDEIDATEFKGKVRRFCREKLDKFKIPTKIKVVEKTNFGDRFKKLRGQ